MPQPKVRKSKPKPAPPAPRVTPADVLRTARQALPVVSAALSLLSKTSRVRRLAGPALALVTAASSAFEHSESNAETKQLGDPRRREIKDLRSRINRTRPQPKLQAQLDELLDAYFGV